MPAGQEAHAWCGPLRRRCGVLAVKAGMTHEWDQWGAQVPLTVLWLDDCQVALTCSQACMQCRSTRDCRVWQQSQVLGDFQGGLAPMYR